MKLFRSLLVTLVFAGAIGLLAACSTQPDNTPEDSATVTTAQPAATASASNTSAPTQQAQSDSNDSTASDVWEAVTWPFRAVADVVGIIL